MMEFEDNIIYADSGEEIHSFRVDSDVKANWALKKIKEEEAERDRLLAIIDEERKDLLEKEEKIRSSCDTKTGWLRMQLMNYFYTVPHKETKTQESYKLFDGSLVYKKPSVSIVKPDEEKLLAYLRQADHMEYIETKESVRWGELKKTLTLTDTGEIISEDGEVLDFIQTEEKAGEFNVK